MKFFESLFARLKSLTDALIPARKLEVIEGDSLPKHLPRRNLVLAREDGEDWCVGMRCPCGCGRTIELQVFPEARPKWKLSCDEKNRPTLHPSVWVKDGCKSHFWLREGQILWCTNP